jgi:hypothetical protein
VHEPHLDPLAVLIEQPSPVGALRLRASLHMLGDAPYGVVIELTGASETAGSCRLDVPLQLFEPPPHREQWLARSALPASAAAPREHQSC